MPQRRKWSAAAARRFKGLCLHLFMSRLVRGDENVQGEQMQMYVSHEVTFTSLMEAACGWRNKVWRERKKPSPEKLTSPQRPLFCNQNTAMLISLFVI